MSGGPFVLAAGGTGGHLFPAQALAERLVRHGAGVCLVTDRRADAFAELVPGIEIRQIRAGRLGGGPLQSARGVLLMAVGFLQARRLLRRLAPAAVVGFGGYPSVPTMLAAIQLGLPTVIHERNAVLGRANRLLAARIRRIATGFADERSAAGRPGRRAGSYTGNPVRPAIAAAAATRYRPPRAGAPIELLILGGSQGARIFADIVHAGSGGIGCRRKGWRARLSIVSQVGPGARDCARVAALCCEGAGIAAEVEKLFHRCAGAPRAGPAGDLPGRSVDRGRARLDRPAGVPRALPARVRRPPDGQCPRLRRVRRRLGDPASRAGSAPILTAILEERLSARPGRSWPRLPAQARHLVTR